MPASNPDLRTADARTAALCRHRGPQHPSTLAARSAAEALRLEVHIRRALDADAGLSAEQRLHAAQMLMGGAA